MSPVPEPADPLAIVCMRICMNPRSTPDAVLLLAEAVEELATAMMSFPALAGQYRALAATVRKAVPTRDDNSKIEETLP